MSDNYDPTEDATETEQNLRRLCHPSSEAMSDFDRINAFVTEGIAAADLLRCYRLQSKRRST